jgi:hypothetical protein
MEEIQARYNPTPSLNIWFLILLTALVPLLLFFFFFFKWYNQRADFLRMRNQFVLRQNTVLAYDAMEVSTGFSDLLEKAGRDVRILATVTPSADNYLAFYKAQMGDFTRYETNNNESFQQELPFYNKVAFLDDKGTTRLAIEDWEVLKHKRTLEECLEKNLCDHSLIQKATDLPLEGLWYGTVLRYYSPEGTAQDYRGASLSVVYRNKKGIFLLGIDYRHLVDHLTSPSFPYEEKKNVADAYQKGNYIYIVDFNNNIVTHPLAWTCAGIDKETGEWVKPMRVDSEQGKHPLNIAAYQDGVLKNYFERLVKISFAQKGVDIFRAPNLAGTTRILSVAPVSVTKGQFQNKGGIFGHVVIGCNVDYFEEPKDRIMPYY